MSSYLYEKAEVSDMLLTEFDQEAYERAIYEASFEEGYRQGYAIGVSWMCKLTEILLSEERYDDLKRASTDPVFRKQMLKEYHIWQDDIGV